MEMYSVGLHEAGIKQNHEYCENQHSSERGRWRLRIMHSPPDTAVEGPREVHEYKRPCKIDSG